MPLRRSHADSNHSFMTMCGKQFVIEPEYLYDAEIEHELRIRGDDAQGDRRVLSAKLRRCIAEEHRNPGARVMYRIGLPPTEFEYCNRGTDRLRAMLEGVTRDPVTHDRFMTVLLHLEGRLNRIDESPTLNLSQVIYSLNEEYSDLYNNFVQRIKALYQPAHCRINQENPRTNASQIESVSTQRDESTIVNVDDSASVITGQLNNNCSNIPTTRVQPIEIQVNAGNAGVVNSNGSHIERERENNTIRDREIPNMHNNRALQVTDNNNNLQSGIGNNGQNPNAINDGVQMLSYILHRLERMSLGQHGTMNHDDNARMSQHFGDIITPIQTSFENRNSMGNANETNLSQPTISNVNINDQSLSHMALNRLSTDNNNRIYGRTPSHAFGAGRINTLPNNFGGRNDHIDPHREQQIPIDATHNTLVERVDALLNAMAALTNKVTEISVWKDSLVENPRPTRTNDYLPLQMSERVYSNAQVNPVFTSNANIPSREITNVRMRLGGEYSDMPGGTNNGPPSRSLPFHNDMIPNDRQFPSVYNSQSVQSERSGYRTSNVPIHKWNWKFSADKSSKVPEQRDLAAFLKKLELYREAEGLTYEQIHQKFHYLIEGCVYEWYMQYRSNFANWEQLREGLSKQFTTPLTHFMKVAKLAARRQKKDESAMDYIASVQREFDSMGIYSEKEKISVIQNGLKDRLRLVAMSHQWQTVQELDLHLRSVEVADELHEETTNKTFHRVFQPRRIINAIETNK